MCSFPSLQVHPTGFVDPANPDAKVKTLCAEVSPRFTLCPPLLFTLRLLSCAQVLRGLGGIIVDPSGKRFADELGTRDYLVRQCVTTPRRSLIFRLILMQLPLLFRFERVTQSLPSFFTFKCQPPYSGAHHRMAASDPKGPRIFNLILNNETATLADKHVPWYVSKGLLTRHDTLASAAAALRIPLGALQDTFSAYVASAAAG